MRHAYELIRDSVTEKKGAEHFEGVTVQPMVNWTGYELILGSSIDPQFGPVLLFGMGGQLVEVFKDRALGLPPLTTTLARRMMESTKIYTALKGVRGRRGVDLDELEQLLVRFSQLVAEQPWVSELDINPLLASPERLIALDARVVLHDPATDPKDLPRLAIRPYPRKYVSSWTCPDGHELTIRPIRPEDEPLMVDFHRSLSDGDGLPAIPGAPGVQRADRPRAPRADLLRRLRPGDGPRRGVRAPRPQPAGESWASDASRGRSAPTMPSSAVLVTDARQGIGVGTELLRRIVDVARAEGVATLSADMRADNAGMRRAAEKVGFAILPGAS